MEFDFKRIEQKTKGKWAKSDLYKVTEDASKPKFYVLDMFPYPSGAGLHVGHPLGYVASDIFSRYKKMKGFNVLHPMGYDAFGLPAEQYAVETGTHPEVTTEKAITRYREQLDKIGFSYDWSRQVKTSDPKYYKWTQWIFQQLFKSWYNRANDKAEPIETLIVYFEKNGTQGLPNFDEEKNTSFTAEEWHGFSSHKRYEILMEYRLAYQAETEVNWCEALGTVLANDEVKDGKSERGGYPVTKKKMRQWSLRITEYSERLIQGLEKLEWSESIKEIQRNWIGKSEGALVRFHLTQTLSNGEGLLRYHTTDSQTWNANLDKAKEMRHNPTETEEIVWQRLRNKQTGFKFRRQHPIGKFIPDFVCIEKQLIVEIDGKIHLQQQAEDKARTEELEQLGYTVIRFTNEEVIANTDGVIAQITAKLKALADTKALSFGEGLGEVIEVFTTRPDTIFGVTFMVLAPEHELVSKITTEAQKSEVENYIAYVKSRSDIERQAEKKVTGVFTGAYVEHPFTGKQVPVWLSEYVLAGYGTGAIMAVPSDDERDRKFAEKFGLPIIEVIDRTGVENAEIGDKNGVLQNSDFLNRLPVKEAIAKIISEIETRGIGKRKVNYKQRDAGFSRQRYWGEPFPIKYVQKDGKTEVELLPESELPLELPPVSSFKPTGDGRSPLANNTDWVNAGYETDTMPGFAGSSWYFLRYMDANNPNEFASQKALDYWQNVDVYFGGAEHAVGHLLYSRFWHKFLHDLGYVKTDEPFQKMVNQGMIQGQSGYVYRVSSTAFGMLKVSAPDIFVTKEIYDRFKGAGLSYGDVERIRDAQGEADKIARKLGGEFDYALQDRDGIYIVALNEYPHCFDGNKLIVDVFKEKGTSRLGNENALFVPNENGEILTERFVEKMSKSKYNVINPDDVIEKYGADCFRMFEMFLGPIEQSKPWDDKGISGVYNFLRKFWRLFYSPSQALPEGEGLAVSLAVTDEKANEKELKVLHKTIKKVTEDIEKMSFNTSVSAFMIAVNELQDLACHKREILEPLVRLLAPFAPFITEELWSALGNSGSVHQANFPVFEEKYLVESSIEYPISINGKTRVNITLPADATQEQAQEEALKLDIVQKWMDGKPLKKFVFVKGRIINIVV